MARHQTYFISDLHLFARRSTAHEHTEAIRAHARGADTFVLGGDIFDFRWSTLEGFSRTLDAATNWLDDLVTSAPDCQFHFLLGNHDHHPAMIEGLTALGDAHENLSWDPYLLRMGESIFLHGDAADGDGTHGRLVRSREAAEHHRQRGPTASAAYEAVLRTRVHRTVPVIAYPKRRTAKRLMKYLEEVGHGKQSGVEHVYFGHTHRPLHAYRHDGVHFHNGGAPIKGVPFRIVAAGRHH
jgi:UDP-2,3-diacylglucosamine hydrolase